MHKSPGKNKATLSDSPNKGDPRGLKLAANEHISSSVLSGQNVYCWDARNLCVVLIEEEAFLASVSVLTSISFFMLGVGACLEDICKGRRNLI